MSLGVLRNWCRNRELSPMDRSPMDRPSPMDPQSFGLAKGVVVEAPQKLILAERASRVYIPAVGTENIEQV